MAKIPRRFQKQFADTAVANDVSRFGSLAAGLPVFTKDPDSIQQLGNFLQGWRGGVLGNNSPTLQDMNALFYLYAYQLRYLFQQGIAEYNSETEYHEGSLCTSSGVIYQSLVDDNLGEAITDRSFWVPISSLKGSKIIWNNLGNIDSDTTPILEVFDNVGPVWRFGVDDKGTNKLTYAFTIPEDTFEPRNVFLRFNYFTLETSNNLRWEVVAKLRKKDEAVDSDFTTVTTTGPITAISATSKALKGELINVIPSANVNFTAGDLVIIELKQAVTGNTSTQDVFVIDNAELVL